MKAQPHKLLLTLAFLSTLNSQLSTWAQGTAFTYQGRLNDGANPAGGNYDLQFTIYDSTNSPGTIVAGPLTNAATAVSNGAFTVTLDFGPNVFNGEGRWLEIGVRTNGGGPFDNLSPRQRVTSSPYAVHAAEAMEMVNGKVRNPSFIGTTTSVPLELYANNQKGLRLESPSGGVPNLVGGGTANSIAPSVVGSTIAGGGVPGFPNSIGANSSFIGAGNANSINGPPEFNNNFIGAGYGNSIVSGASFIGSGNLNVIQANAWYAFIGSGSNNIVQSGANLAVIGGGEGNTALRPHATIGGGFFNTAGGDYNGAGDSGTVAGGWQNAALGNNATVAGGYMNASLGDDCAIGGGSFNTIQGTNSGSVIAGGRRNMITSATVPGDATIGGGFANTNSGNTATIGGGARNIASGLGATVSGGNQNQAGGTNAVIGGGAQNAAQANYATVAGGLNNLVDGSGSAIGGGFSNTNSGQNATISGGRFNTILPGAFTATIPGGQSNVAGGRSSFAAGRRAIATNDGVLVWGDSSNADIASTNANSVTMRASGGYRLFSNSGATAGAFLAAGGTSWAVISDRNAKKNFAPVDGLKVLQRLAVVPVQQWNYRWEPDDAVPHIGPMAQDFKAAFYPGRDDKTITTQEADGVALAAIQGLNQKVEARSQKSDVRIQKLEAENAELKQRLEKLEQLLKHKLNGGER